VTEALIGLGGVILGVLLTTAAQHLMTKRSEKAELREAARMLEWILFLADMALVLAIEFEHRRIPYRGMADECSRYEKMLARLLRRSDWDTVQRAFAAVGDAENGLAKYADDSDELRKHGERQRRAIAEGLAVFARYSGGRPVDRLVSPAELR
jgi:hypothetical protein